MGTHALGEGVGDFISDLAVSPGREDLTVITAGQAIQLGCQAVIYRCKTQGLGFFFYTGNKPFQLFAAVCLLDREHRCGDGAPAGGR